jgi:cysteine-rich repeat protein
LTVPAAGAVAVIAGTTLRAVATDEGAFALEPITSTTGQLILSLDGDGDGAVELSRALDFSAWNIGPNHETSLGSISLRATATITGTVLLPAASAASSAGSTVFVPGLPLATITSDTGAFVLGGVPEGTFTLAAAHTGYVTARLEGLAARAAEVLELAPISLRVGQAQPATLSGAVALVPAGDLTTVTVTLLGVAGTTPLTSDGTFSLSAAPGAVTVLVQAPGYSDGVLANVLAAGGTTVDLGTVRLTAGSATFDAGSVSTGTDPLCGNGLVDPGEGCDDGNRLSSDGCSAGCTLETQVGGGRGCLDATPVRLVPIAGGQQGALLQASGTQTGDLSSSCTLAGTQTFALQLSGRARVSAASSVRVSMRGPQCTIDELVCGDTVTTGVLERGEHVLAVLTGGGTPKIQLSVSPVKTTSWCGDGIVDGSEECDDGNASEFDGCTSTCALKVQTPSATCLDASLLTLSPTGAGTYGARFSSSGSQTGDALSRPSCFPAATRTNIFQVELTAPGALRVDVTSGATELAIGIFSGTCQASTQRACEHVAGFGGQFAEVSMLAKGRYRVVISASDTNFFTDGHVSVQY